MQSKSKESHVLTDLDNVQQTDISDICGIREHCIPLSIHILYHIRGEWPELLS